MAKFTVDNSVIFFNNRYVEHAFYFLIQIHWDQNILMVRHEDNGEYMHHENARPISIMKEKNCAQCLNLYKESENC